MSRYGKIPAGLLACLKAIPAASDYGMVYRPCDLLLKDGTRCDRVYIVPENLYISTWGVWPEDDKGKRAIRIEDVEDVFESHHRLPAPMADKLYAAGESGMGYTIFTVVFDDGSRMAVGTGNAVDFVDYPEGKSASNVVDVLPHVGRGDPALRPGPEYHWCLYADGA